MRLIDADATAAKLRRMAVIERDMNQIDIAGATLGIAVGLQSDVLYPTIDPVRHGHWIITEDAFGRKFGVCSECGNKDNVTTAVLGHYCWFCGAKMDQNATKD